MEQNTNPYPTLKTLREQAGLSQEELSRMIGTKVRIITDYENRRKLPRADRLALIAKALRQPLKTVYQSFGIDVDDIPD